MSAVIWHDVECGAYTADLKLWEEMAEEIEGPVLDLGCGTGRVSLHLARHGHRVVGLDSEAALLAAFDERAAGLPADAAFGDARGFELEDAFGLALAPMHLVQLFANEDERISCLRSVAQHLRPGGVAAFAIVEDGETLYAPIRGTKRFTGPVPDVREVDEWIYSSLPLDAGTDGEVLVVRRLRQTVSPAGELSDAVDEIRLTHLSARGLEQEATHVGLKSAGRRSIPPTEDHVGSTVVLLEAP
jgi:SAM-dependent methyltransferase